MQFINTVSTISDAAKASINLLGNASSAHAIAETVLYSPSDAPNLYVFLSGPLYLDGLSVIGLNADGTNTPLVLDQDYVLRLPFVKAAVKTNQRIYGAIKFIKPMTGVSFSVYGKTIGGIFLTRTARGAIINEMGSFEDAFYYSDLSALDVPVTPFNATDAQSASRQPNYLKQVNDGFDDGDVSVITSTISLFALTKKTSAIENRASGNALNTHIFNFSNPHNDTAANVGLANVVDRAAATAADLSNPSSQAYITPSDLKTILGNQAAAVYATNTVPGLVIMNSDESNKSSTVLNVIRLLAIRQTPLSALNKMTGVGLWVLKPPAVINFPATWNGTIYGNMTALLAGIASFCKLRHVLYNAVANEIYIPSDNSAIATNTLTVS